MQCNKMSINFIRGMSRLSLVRGASAATATRSFGQYREILNRTNEIPNAAVTFKYRFLCSAASEIDLKKFATYEQIKDLPNHPEKLLIDVREPHELVETGQIPTSINIPLNQVAETLSLSSDDFKKLFNREKPGVETEVIFHCKIGMRSQTAADMCKQLGYKNVKNYKGSWMEWAEKEKLNK